MNKKILFVASGKSFHATRWANALSDRGYEIHYVSVVPFERPLNKNVICHDLSGRNRLLSYFIKMPELREIINTTKPDLVHAHYSSGNGFLAALSLLFMKVPFVTSLYGTEVF